MIDTHLDIIDCLKEPSSESHFNTFIRQMELQQTRYMQRINLATVKKNRLWNFEEASTLPTYQSIDSSNR